MITRAESDASNNKNTSVMAAVPIELTRTLYRALLTTADHGPLVVTKLHQDQRSKQCDLSAAPSFESAYSLRDVLLSDMKSPQYISLYTNFFGGWVQKEDKSYLQVVDVAPTVDGGKMGKLSVQPFGADGARAAGGLLHPTPDEFLAANFTGDRQKLEQAFNAIQQG